MGWGRQRQGRGPEPGGGQSIGVWNSQRPGARGILAHPVPWRGRVGPVEVWPVIPAAPGQLRLGRGLQSLPALAVSRAQ